MGNIGEKTTVLRHASRQDSAWNFSLPDGTNTPRQLSNSSGDITLSARYTPWGDTLELNGTGNFAFGYLGGVLDATTGLLYVGNGQYYDPQTGRFLTRDANQNNSNPYVPWDPSGAIIAPLGIVALFAGRKKKGSKVGTFLVLLLVLGSVGMTLAACGGGQEPTPAEYTGIVTTTTPGSYVVKVERAGTVVGTYDVPTDTPTATLIATVCTPTPSSTVTATQTPVPIPTTDEDYKTLIASRFGIILSDDTGVWATWQIQIVFSALSKIDTALGGTLKTLLGTSKKFCRDWDPDFYGGKTNPDGINFHFNNKFPHQLIYHEMGHLLDYAFGESITYSLDHEEVFDENGDWVMGNDGKDDYMRNNWLGYKEHVLNDPSGFTVSALMHGAGDEDFDGNGDTAGEDWGDLFANYVVGNIDLAVPAGRARHKWVVDHLFPK